MKAPQRLVWSEGMFMSPQHLQALDRYHEALLAARVEAIAPQGWGLVAFEVDAAALGAGQIRVQHFAGIFPDGAPLAFGENDKDAPPPRPAAEHFPAAARSLEVYVGLAREREGVPSYAEEGNTAARSRYTLSTRQVHDATAQSGAVVPVAFGRPNSVILFGDESREDHETLKVAEIVRNQSGQLALSDRYIPPCLRIGVSPFILSGLRDVVTRVISKQRELSQGRRQREGAAGEVSGADVTRFLQLLALNGNVPVLAHLAEAGDAGPREAYLALSRLAGQLSTFAPDSDPTTLPKFAFTDLRATFEPLFERLSALLGGMAIAQYTVVPLEQRPGGLYLARIQDDRILRSQLFLSVKSQMPEQQVVEQLPKLCKIASTAEIQALVQAAAPGLPLQAVRRPPPQLPALEGTLYFSLGTGDRFWQGILANKNIAIYLPPPFDPARTKIELLSLAAPPPGGAAQR